MIFGIIFTLYIGLFDYNVHNVTQFTENVEIVTTVDEIDIDYYFDENFNHNE